MLHRRLVARAFMSALAVMAISGTAAAQNGRVTGIVREEGGQPLKGATVTAESPAFGQSFTATTDDKGRFNMLGLRTGEWRFIAQAPGHSPEGGMLVVRSGSSNAPVTFELKHSGVAFFGALGGIVAKDLQAELAAADALYSQQKWDEAIAAYRVVLARVPVITSINLQIASAYRNKKDYDAAMVAYNDILKAEPANETARIEMAMTALERGDVKSAQDTLTRAASEPTASRDVFYNLGEVTLAANDPDASRHWFEKASAADPYWAKPLLRLGEAAIKIGDGAGAAKLFTRAVEVDPTAPEAATAKTALESLKK